MITTLAVASLGFCAGWALRRLTDRPRHSAYTYESTRRPAGEPPLKLKKTPRLKPLPTGGRLIEGDW